MDTPSFDLILRLAAVEPSSERGNPAKPQEDQPTRQEQRMTERPMHVSQFELTEYNVGAASTGSTVLYAVPAGAPDNGRWDRQDVREVVSQNKQRSRIGRVYTARCPTKQGEKRGSSAIRLSPLFDGDW